MPSAVSAQSLDGYSESELWFNSLSEDERKSIQSDLILTGNYFQLLDGEFGKGTYNAVRSFEAANGTNADGQPPVS